MHNIHLVFHVVKLCPAVTDPILGRQADPPPPLVIVDDEEHYKIEAILDSHIFCYKLQYWFKWKGSRYEDVCWELAEGIRALI